MNPANVQAIVLRAPEGRAVAHLILPVPSGYGKRAAEVLGQLRPSFGLDHSSSDRLSVGFAFAGLEALGVPDGYLGLFRAFAPSFAAGAIRRSVELGDYGDSAASNWQSRFRQERAHVILSWHGSEDFVQRRATGFAAYWRTQLSGTDPVASDDSSAGPDVPLVGVRLGAPPGEDGEWVHFGFRDGISDLRIDEYTIGPMAPDTRMQAPGALVVGHINDAGFNRFALGTAPAKVRTFFHDSSFGVLRPMRQDVAAFEAQVDRWAGQLRGQVAVEDTNLRDFIKAKLCGRWPNGTRLVPGAVAPSDPKDVATLVLGLAGDDAGEGCPFGSHVRRMRAAPDPFGFVYERPLQRRSMPFGTAAWAGPASDDLPRGHIGHFFCASLEDQFEHLVGRWAARPPLASATNDTALDPLSGPESDPQAALQIPLQGQATQSLSGFRAWTTTLGTMYAWHPGRAGWQALIEDDLTPEADLLPWL